MGEKMVFSINSAESDIHMREEKNLSRPLPDTRQKNQFHVEYSLNVKGEIKHRRIS